MSRAAYPGSFNPPTIAHVAIAAAARERHDLDRVDLVVSRVPLVKGVVEQPALADRLEVLQRLADRLGWLGVVVSERQLIAELAEGYDVVIMGADKWEQVHDLAFYDGSAARRDAAVAGLPTIAVAPRPPHVVPTHLVLDVPDELSSVSSTLARRGAVELMVPEALASGLWKVDRALDLAD